MDLLPRDGRVTNLETYRPAPLASQATAIEQARAVAEVQAAVIVAQQCPRDMLRAEADMRDVCGRLSMAERAFYRVPNRGTGPSVHLMRELARLWGNIDYGVRELRRDDDAQESEMQAWAWDQQTNTRSSRSFIVPHARMKGKDRQRLTDLGDVYLNNQNVGARAVRECINTVLPTWFSEAAQDICRRTLEDGEGEPLADRIEGMVRAFGGIGITVKQLEARIGSKRGRWSAGDVAEMGIVYKSIQRDGLDKDSEFPPQATDLTKMAANENPAPSETNVISPSRLKRLQILCNESGLTDRTERLAWASDTLGAPVTTFSKLTPEQGNRLFAELERDPDQPESDGAQA